MAESCVVHVGAQLAAALFREADEWEAKGSLENAWKARDAARAQLVRDGFDSREAAAAAAQKMVPFTAGQDRQRAIDVAVDEAAVAVAVAEAANSNAIGAALRGKRDRAVELAGKLDAGTVTAAEQREALALSLRAAARLSRLLLHDLDKTD